MSPPLGLILTHAPDLAAVRAALVAMRASALKLIPAWGLDGGWTPAAIAEAAHLAPTLVVRTSWGDPSYAGGARALPYANQILDELAPWLRARPDAWVELGNEPRVGDHLPDPHVYAHHLGEAVTACRAMFPQARLIAPAHSLNDPAGDPAVAAWLTICAPVYRRCDAVAIHAYTVDQLRRGLSLIRTHVGGRPIWLTEFALDEALPDAERGQRYREVLDDAPVAAALLYHLDLSSALPTAEQGPARYRLQPATLAALAAPPPLGAPTGVPDTLVYRERIDGFLMDVRQWRTVAAFRRHLAQYTYAKTAPWAKGITVHHTANPWPHTWRGVATILAMARHYRGLGWSSGPHFYSVSGAPDPFHDGIWQLSPANLPGVHGNACNRDRWGWEVVGQFDTALWDAGTAAYALGGIAALHDWAGWAGTHINGHRDCAGVDKGKTCPGRAIDLDAVRRGVAAMRGAL